MISLGSTHFKSRIRSRSLPYVLALVFAAVAVPDGGQASQPSPKQITVTGEGVVHSVPDMAVITLGVIHQHADAAQAMAQSSTAAQAILDRLSGFGIAARDVQTGQVNLSPVYSRQTNGKPVVIEGFRAALSLNVRVRDLDDLGEVMGAVLRDGANQFSGLRFGLQTPGPQEDAARKAAVAEALRKAQLYADAAGVSLGDILSISEHSGRTSPQMRMAAEMASAVPIAEGELSVSQSVTLVIELE